MFVGIDTTRQEKTAGALRELDRIVAEVALSLAHELNQPLCAIISCADGCLEKVRSQGGCAPEIVQAIEEIANQAERTGQILRSLRNFMRKRDPERAPVDLDEVVGEAVGLMASEARTNGIKVSCDLADDLLPVMADKIQIEQVLVNLIRNALEAMRDTEWSERNLSIRAFMGDTDMAEVAISDAGCGLPEGDTEKIFQSFYSTKPQGLGIGLSISRSIINNHRGRLWAVPNPDRGTTLCFSLPTA